MAYSYTNRGFRGKKLLSLCLAAIVIVVALAGIYWRVYMYTPANKAITTAGNVPKPTTPSSSATPTAQQPPKKPSNNTQNTTGGGGVDTNGQTTAQTNPNQWITSKSGVITVEQPTANATLKSGDYLVGTAKVGSVTFRLSDTSSGQIAEGTLQVVNGKFSGKLGFTPHSSAGELDIFSTNAQGVELNEIQIGVKF